jgi:DNA-binding FadR family transcriptional regulator
MKRGIKLSERIARAIVQDISKRGLRAGDKLPPEAEMVRQYDVGRASLREALRILEVNGVITLRPGPNGGPTIMDVDTARFAEMTSVYLHLSRAKLSELMQAQFLLEPLCARLAARHRTEADIARMSACLDRASSLAGHAEHDWFELSREFHSALIEASGNRVISLLTTALQEMYSDKVVGMLSPTAARKDSLERQESILQAIKARDSQRAEALMKELMEVYGIRLRRHIDTRLDDIIEWR